MNRTALFLTLCFALLATSCPVVRAADRPAGLLGKVSMTLAARALEARNPAQMADMAVLLQAKVFEAVGERSGTPWDLAALKRELAMQAMSEAGATVRDPLSRLLADPILTSLFPVFTGEVPIGSVQVGRIGTALALHALKTPDPALKAATGHLLSAHALERATRDKDEIWDVRTLKEILAMFAMSPDGEAVRADLSLLLSNAPAMAALFPVFER